MNVAAILPCRGRREQTIVNVKRLLATAGYDQWRLYAIGGKEESDTLTALAKLGIPTMTARPIGSRTGRHCTRPQLSQASR